MMNNYTIFDNFDIDIRFVQFYHLFLDLVRQYYFEYKSLPYENYLENLENAVFRRFIFDLLKKANDEPACYRVVHMNFIVEIKRDPLFMTWSGFIIVPQYIMQIVLYTELVKIMEKSFHGGIVFANLNKNKFGFYCNINNDYHLLIHNNKKYKSEYRNWNYVKSKLLSALNSIIREFYINVTQ
jgi:hypothetical protein